MMIPKEIKIGWRKYQIIQGEHRGDRKGNDVYGEISYEDSKIYLYEKLSTDNKKVVLLHELLHALGYLIGNITFRKDEELITALSENLYQVIKDNPDLFKYLGSDDDVSG